MSPKKKSASQKVLPLLSTIITGFLLISASPALAQNLDDGNPTPPTPIPEPSTALGVFAVGAVGVGLLLKHNLKRKQ